jgi:prepilin signal peptidase PulO-like enzyme (type II secretory pathway)
MPLIRKQLIANEVYPDNIRYNPDTDTVQSLVNGEWVDNPSVDPRLQTTFPPRVTDDTRCDAAQSVSDAFKNQIDAIILAIDNGSTAFTIAGLVLGLLSFGVFAIFISIALAIADAMIGAGASALTAALTGAVYEQFTCILYCNMNGDGRLLPGGFEAIQSDVASQIGGLAGTTLNAMIALAGEGGINNLASLGESTGNCSGCTDCDCLHPFDVIVGDFVSIGDDGLGHFIELTAVFAVHAGSANYWAVVGGSEFCCIYQTFSVVSGGISSGGLLDCEGNPTGAGNPTGQVEFYHVSAPFTIKYYFS